MSYYTDTDMHHTRRFYLYDVIRSEAAELLSRAQEIARERQRVDDQKQQLLSLETDSKVADHVCCLYTVSRKNLVCNRINIE